jgi:hypothetical protein
MWLKADGFVERVK